MKLKSVHMQIPFYAYPILWWYFRPTCLPKVAHLIMQETLDNNLIYKN